jgi:phage virion morphogenesis protein
VSTKLVADFSGLNRTQALLRQIGDRVADPKPLLVDIGAALVQSTRERFDTMTDPTGKKWTPLSADTQIGRMGGTKRVYTQKMRFRKGAAEKMGNLRILFRQGHLRNSITSRASRTGVEIGTNLAYGALHQFGGQAGRGRKITVPARPYLGLSTADEDKIETLAQDYLREVLP